MSKDPELDRLILEHLGDLDATAKHIEVVEVRVWAEIAERVEQWAAGKGWIGSYDVDDDIWVAPIEWQQGDDDPLAWFAIGYGPGDRGNGVEGEAYFGLSRLAGVGEGRLCLWLGFEGVNRSVWRRVFRLAVEQDNTGGFVFDERDGLFVDCTPPAGLLADAVAEGQFDLAFAPLDGALEAAHAGWRVLDRLLKEARA